MAFTCACFISYPHNAGKSVDKFVASDQNTVHATPYHTQSLPDQRRITMS
jgi:hypothetical protein